MRFAVFLLAVMLAFGCFGCIGSQLLGNQPQGGNKSVNLPSIPGTTPPVEECTPSQTFSEPADGVLSQTTELVATVTCAAGKQIVVKVDGEPIVTTSVDTNATQPVKLDIPATKDGAHTLTVDIGGETLLSRDWNVQPLGNTEVKGLETDAISYKEWRAMAVDIGNPISAARVKAYLKTQQPMTHPDTNIVMEIRKDNGARPGDMVTSVRKTIKAVTQTYNWINFDLDPAQTLQPGRYWIVLKVEQTEDVNLASDIVQLHYTTVDKTSPGNDHTKQMLLSVDTKTGLASEAQWQPLAYDKEYNIVLTTSK